MIILLLKLVTVKTRTILLKTSLFYAKTFLLNFKTVTKRNCRLLISLLIKFVYNSCSVVDRGGSVNRAFAYNTVDPWFEPP